MLKQTLPQIPQHNYLRDWIYGGIDGAITTFAIVAGVVGAGLEPFVIIILGFANLIADGFSMAASNYLGTKSEEEQFKRFQAIEEQEIRETPDIARDEIRQIYRDKGVTGKTLDEVVFAITADKKLWVNTMLHEEYGLPAAIRSPWKAALSTFSAFLICGFVPLIPYLFAFNNSFLMAAIFTGIVFFAIGSVKSIWSVHSWWWSGLVTLFIGTVAAALAFAIGYLVHFYFGVGIS